jgi:hypothetical protein
MGREKIGDNTGGGVPSFRVLYRQLKSASRRFRGFHVPLPFILLNDCDQRRKRSGADDQQSLLHLGQKYSLKML